MAVDDVRVNRKHDQSRLPTQFQQGRYITRWRRRLRRLRGSVLV